MFLFGTIIILLEISIEEVNTEYFMIENLIGGKLTEINVTSPTGLQELERFENKNFASNVWDKVISKIKL